MRIKIKQYKFEISAPYAEGHVLTDLEAQALNALRAENIRNNMAKVVDRELAVLSPGEILPDEILNDLRERVAQYDRVYKFSPKFGATAINLFEQECIVIGDAMQRDPNDPLVRAEAVKRMQARSKVATATAQEMGI